MRSINPSDSEGQGKSSDSEAMDYDEYDVDLFGEEEE